MADSDTDTICTPPDIRDAANAASMSLLPEKSLKIYEHTYKKFMEWRCEKNIHSFSENVVLSYISELAQDIKSSTLWSTFSMLKTTINIKHNINIGEYAKVRAYLKRKNEGYAPKKSRVLEKEQIAKFIKEAPDDIFLLTKVSLKITISNFLIFNI